MDLTHAAHHYYQYVSEAADYLKGRGVTGEMAQQALLGVCRDPLPGHDQYEGRIVIPYLTPAGVVDLRFRCIDGSGPKYLSLPGHKPRLYNTVALASDPPVVGITEGEFDALVAGGARFERGVRDGDGWDVDREHPERIRLVGSLCRHAVSQRILAWDGVWNQRCVMYP